MNKKRPLTLEELEEFFIQKDSPKYVHDLKYRAIMGTLLLLGCRIGELIGNRPEVKKNNKHIEWKERVPGLRWKDINLDGAEFGYIQFKTRTEKNPKNPYREIIVPIKWGKAPKGMGEKRWNRMISIEKACLAALDKWTDLQEKLQLRKPNNEVFPVGFHNSKVEISKLMGKDDDGNSLTSHYFRHTRTSWDDERGLSISENASQRGHSKLETTSIYLHPNKGNIIRKLTGG